jgi:hypothetical protein
MPDTDSITLRHITLATDLTARSDRAFERAVGLAQRWKARLLIVHAVEERRVPTDQPSWRRGPDAVQAARMKLQLEYPGWESVDTSSTCDRGRRSKSSSKRQRVRTPTLSSPESRGRTITDAMN